MVSSRRNRSVQDSRTIPTDHFPVLASRIQPEAEITVTAITLNGSPSVKTITPTRPRCRRQASSRSGLYRHGCLDANLHPRSRQLRRSGTYATFTNGLISAATRIPHQVVDTPRLSTRPTTGPRPGNVGFQARDFRPHLRLTTTPRNGIAVYALSLRPS